MARHSQSYNPYTPDAGVRPPALVGRETELEHLQSIITQLNAGGTERPLLITGLRGVGKTVVLNEFENACAEAGWPAESKEVSRSSSAAVLVGRSGCVSCPCAPMRPTGCAARCGCSPPSR